MLGSDYNVDIQQSEPKHYRVHSEVTGWALRKKGVEENTGICLEIFHLVLVLIDTKVITV